MCIHESCNACNTVSVLLYFHNGSSSQDAFDSYVTCELMDLRAICQSFTILLFAVMHVTSDLFEGANYAFHLTFPC